MQQKTVGKESSFRHFLNDDIIRDYRVKVHLRHVFASGSENSTFETLRGHLSNS